jgi:hypothetical protein
MAIRRMRRVSNALSRFPIDAQYFSRIGHHVNSKLLHLVSIKRPPIPRKPSRSLPTASQTKQHLLSKTQVRLPNKPSVTHYVGPRRRPFRLHRRVWWHSWQYRRCTLRRESKTSGSWSLKLASAPPSTMKRSEPPRLQWTSVVVNMTGLIRPP